MSNINFETIERTDQVHLPENLVFGRNFSDHVFEMDYDEALGGWHNATIKKYQNLNLSPAALVLHYGQTIFEGLKAYKQKDGSVGLFRPEKNFERLNNSAKRLCMPTVDVDFMVNALKELINVDKDWIPTKPGYSLYIRPLMFGYDPFLGVRPANNYKLVIMLSPVGPYYPEGFKPVPILATDKFVRAVRKGVGECKTAGNYAASLLAQKEAQKIGFTQVLWLDAIEQKYIEEVGTMNLFVKFKDEVVTPPLHGTILPGITRMSVIQILNDWGMNIQERRVSLDEVFEANESGTLEEIFGTGTAAVISSVGRLKYGEKEIRFSDEEAGELSKKLYSELTAIQYGEKEDSRNWMQYL
ncbi:MAG: branched-chain amino acid aminotransferase [Melioribacteraceae bacterium]|nr:branched-chain amino acid aminotransferase [Melioribacteraceae bacterium]MCF8265618.1 branched-chain amino acid aminotransferase [Melioribacteraceae bacterium]MCF8411874.1 branched-chain amino acid aminotransferase [Melioribacteraceae bacterium]MCF8432238.1 branched-chain amino acid aminotransferase [Melioribacteraceae bacterium]